MDEEEKDKEEEEEGEEVGHLAHAVLQHGVGGLVGGEGHRHRHQVARDRTVTRVTRAEVTCNLYFKKSKI